MSAPLLVADSGPLIALARLGLLVLPSKIFREVLVTATVWEEVTRSPKSEHPVLLAARDEQLLQVVPDPAEMPQSLSDRRLDEGERSAIALALTLQATVLVDERHGRALARAVGLPVVGTLGILVKARQNGLVSHLRPLTNALTASGYYLAPALVDQALAVVGE